MSLNASSCFVKTNHARVHCEQLKQAREKMPANLGLAFEFRGTGTERVAYLRMREPIPPHVSCIVGDIVHNVRSALDHLACR